MTTKDEIYELLLVRANDRLVDQVLVDVSSQLDLGVDEVVSAMWDLVDRGDLIYGTNARVARRCRHWNDRLPDGMRLRAIQCGRTAGHVGSHVLGGTTWGEELGVYQ